MKYFLCLLLLVSVQVESIDFSEFDLQCAVMRKKTAEFEAPKDDVSIINLEGEPSAIVNNCVNAITGDYLDFETDLVVPGAQPIVMHRNYSSSLESTWGGWDFNHIAMLTVEPVSKLLWIYSYEGSGVLLRYEGLNQIGSSSRLVSSAGLTNCGNREISGRTNRKNTRILSAAKDSFLMRFGSGGARSYEKFKKGVQYDYFKINHEKTPNGNQFFYKNLDKETRKIFAANSTSKLLAYVTKHGSEEDNPPVIIKACDGRTSTYSFEKMHGNPYLTRAVHTHAPSQSYIYAPSSDKKRQQLIRKMLPDRRCVGISYYKKEENQVLNKKILLPKKDPRIDRVKCLRAPVGTTAAPVITHAFVYHIKHDKKKKLEPSYTSVYDAQRRKSFEYHYDRRYYLNKVVKFVKKKPYRQDLLFWGSDVDRGNLISRVLESDNQNLFCRHLDYDKHGNILVEQLWGSLTGRNEFSLKVDGEGNPKQNGCEVYEKRFKYSKNGFNLPIFEDNGRTQITTGYAARKDLVKERFTADQERIRQRQFYEYDDNAVLIKEIRDDGSSEDKNSLSDVTERHITYITPREQMPIGLPEVIEEKYLDLTTGEELLLKKIVNAHSKEGYLLCQDHYDSEGKHAYSLKWEYDAMGNVLTEVNALEEVTQRRYDANRNMIFEQGPCPDYYKEFTYDFANRLIREEEVYTSGLRLSTTHKYNRLSQRTASTDFYGNETTYHYDECGRLISTHLPNGAVLKTEYNALDQPIATYDANGNCTRQGFTIRGKPCQTQYPDGSVERQEYTLDGLLERSVAKNGMITLYSYDSLGHVISQEKLTPSGERFSITHSTYNSFHLLSETDEAGYLTQYQYDAAGRLIATIKGEIHTESIYDSLGRIVRTLEYTQGDDYCATVREYDFLDRVILEQIEDASGQVFKKERYAYDCDGNCIQTIAYTQAGKAKTVTTYNAHQEPVCTIDALGNATHTLYRYDYYNSLGQCVPYQETTDPLGNITILIKDLNGYTAEVVKRDAFGQIIQSLSFTRDLNGNCLSQVTLDLKTTQWKYDSLNRVIHTIEAAGTPEQKHTRFFFNLYGEKEKIVKADGTELLYYYDDFGRLSSYKGKDFHYSYQYDLNSNPVCVKNHLANTTTQRAYDQNDRLITEILENGLQLQYTYDRIGRLLTLTLPDNSKVDYTYDAHYLRQVQRGAYTHHYADFDLAENLLSAETSVGTLSYEYDRLSRLTKLTTPQTQDSFYYDAIGNLLKKVTPSETLTYTYDSLYQLTSEPEHTYAYDSCYNRTAKDDTPYTLNSLNQILKQNSAHYTYSPNGSLIKKVQNGSVTTYDYDGLDRLTQVHQGDNHITYQYDAFNRRISKTHNGLTTHYLYQEQNEIGAYINNPPTELRILGSGLGAEIGAAVLLELAQTYIPTHDQNGNISALVIPSGECVETYRYTAFGEEQSCSTLNPWRFSSKRYDPETGFLYFGQRYYASDLGRWITPDPLDFEDGPNLYAYVHNNPLTSVDLYGLFDDNFNFSVSNWRNGWDGLLNFSKGLSQGSVTSWCNDFGKTYTEFGTKPMFDEGEDWNQSCHYFGERCGEAFTMALITVGTALATDAIISAAAPTVMAGVTGNTIYNYASKGFTNLCTRFGLGTTAQKTAEFAVKNGVSLSRGAESVNARVLLNRKLISHEIAGGHAFEKHASEFGFKTQEQMASHIDKVLTSPTMSRQLSKGRTAFWHDASRSVVIRNPTTIDGGTAFIPKNGVNYFLKEIH